MNNQNQSSRFFDGFLLGVIVGALGVFLFGTKSGKNLVKIVSEQGLEGISKLMEEYNLMDIEEFDEEPKVKKEASHNPKHHQEETNEEVKETVGEEVVEKAPKKRFFKRLSN